MGRPFGYCVNGITNVGGRGYWRVDELQEDGPTGLDFLNSPFAIVRDRESAETIADMLTERAAAPSPSVKAAFDAFWTYELPESLLQSRGHAHLGVCCWRWPSETVSVRMDHQYLEGTVREALCDKLEKVGAWIIDANWHERGPVVVSWSGDHWEYGGPSAGRVR